MRKLELLTRDEIVEVIKGTGLHGPPKLVQEIVVQAEGKPGLAVTLADLCKKGGIRDLAQGAALVQHVRTFETLVAKDAIQLLAAFAIAGDSGMCVDDVADALALPKSTAHKSISELAAGGVLKEVDRHHISVRPPRLRFVLVKDVFFGEARLDCTPLIARSPCLAETVSVLIGAKAVGGDVPDELLLQILNESDSLDAWIGYAYLGIKEASCS